MTLKDFFNKYFLDVTKLKSSSLIRINLSDQEVMYDQKIKLNIFFSTYCILYLVFTGTDTNLLKTLQ